MKRLFPLFYCCLIVLFPLLSTAQYWDLVQPDRKMLFSKGTDELNWVISIDSSFVVGGDTLHYPYRILNGDEFASGCRNPFSISWLGSQIIERANGEYVYFNRGGDSIWVQPAAPLNASWKMMDLPNGGRLTAEVIQLDDLGANPIPDTLKTIRLQALTSGGFPITSHPAHELRLKWSRTLGWQTTVDFRSFPDSIQRFWFEGARNPVVGTSLPSHTEVYDLGVGNEFHYIEYYSSYTSFGTDYYTRYYQRFILDQVITPSTVTYTDSIIEVKYSDYYNTGVDTTYDTYTQTTQVVIDTTLPEPLALFYIPQTWLAPDVMLHNTTCRPDTTWGGTVLREFYYDKAVPATYIFDTCLYSSASSDYAAEELYVDGLGKVFWEHEGFSNFGAYYGVKRETLAYYKKGTMEWGDPVVVDSLALGSVNTWDSFSWSVFPNPASDKLVIACETGLFPQGSMIEWRDVMGRKLAERKVAGTSSVEWTRQGWPSGVYWVKAFIPGQGVGVRKVVWR